MNPLVVRRIGLILLTLAVLMASWVTTPDQVSRQEVEKGLARALATHAAARALGAVVAVAQSSQVAVQPAGVGVEFAPGQALKPIGDLIEQFSNLMLAASVVFGVHLLLLQMGAHWLLSALLSAALLAWVALRWSAKAAPPGSGGARVLQRLAPLLAVLLLLRFGAPLIALANEGAYGLFLAKDYTTAQSEISGTARAASQDLPQGAPPQSEDESWLGRLKRLVPKAPDFGATYERIKARADETVGYLARLLAVFLLQTVVIPIGMLWLLWRTARAVLGRGNGS